MAGKPGTGGAAAHKNPLCACTTCTHNRRAKTLAIAARAGRDAVDAPPPETEKVIDADASILSDRIHFSIRFRIEQWIALRITEPNLTNTEAAEKMGISRTHLQHCIRVAVREGWLKFTEPISRIDHEIIPKAIDNLSELLTNKNKTATLETVKNTVFKQYLESKGVRDAPMTVLALKIEATPVVEGEVVRAMTGHIVGAPRELNEKAES